MTREKEREKSENRSTEAKQQSGYNKFTLEIYYRNRRNELSSSFFVVW